ncbi:hypothetical protein M378DRAFT_164281 [Amanita muscaria Koide BX008]|uniref:Uncharacterized protein n=1 Tax=Amanita muscaria (strain Koide BX008) TaxID=946122 RepID=A0A0C2TAA2_AMAMK|nr:hypothetical protein M378DRAFT_164281 [Amanita muscaria Koide BX008]
MLQENPKRAASTSPVGSPARDLKRLHLATNLWSESDHLQQDDIVKQRLLGKGLKPRTYDFNEIHMALVLKRVAQVASEGPHSHLLHIPAAEDHYIDALEEDPDFMKLVGDCYTNGSYKDVRCLAFLRKNPASAFTQNSGEKDKMVDISSSHSATEKAWNEKYVGSAADCLYDTIKGHCARGDPVVYARYASIIQSSGMGKSRMIDELSKKHLVLPINLRLSSDTGFPAADLDVRTFLTVDETEKDNIHRRSHAFLIALFAIARSYLQNIDQHITNELRREQNPQTIAQKFRLLMTAGQTFNHQGFKRCEFYSAVVKYANELLQPPIISAPLDSSIRQLAPHGEQLDTRRAALDLLKCLNPELEAAEIKTLKTIPPLVILAFEEAHVLLVEKHQSDIGYFSKFSELRRALRAVNELPIFSVFLSTSGKIQNITPHAEDDGSGRLLPPFIELGFDQMVGQISDGALTIETVSNIKFMVRFGRPLFGSRYFNGDADIRNYIVYYAAEKLLGGVAFPHTPEAKKETFTSEAKLACMAVRLALEFNATTLASQNRERTQVEKHMRVCLVMNPGNEAAVTIAPSEPILAEAAYLLMQDREAFDLPGVLFDELQRPGLYKGDRGELICLVLLLIARDVAVQEKRSAVIDVLFFLEKLLASQWSSTVFDSRPARCCTNTEDQRPFSEAFEKSKMYFNHFIKVHDLKVINRDFLWRLIARGAAVLCADNQGGIDVLLPFLYLDNKLGRDNVSGIFIQVKNDQIFSSTPNLFLFDAMDPYILGFFDVDEQKPVPIIRMVFALASSESCIKAVEGASLRKNPTRTATPKGKERACPPYTAYDIWCAGTSAETFSVVRPGDEEVYSDLLKLCRPFPGVYEAHTEIDSAKSARRNMNPGTAAHPDHWHWFSTAGQDEAADDDVEMQI